MTGRWIAALTFTAGLAYANGDLMQAEARFASLLEWLGADHWRVTGARA